MRKRMQLDQIHLKMYRVGKNVKEKKEEEEQTST